MFFFLSRYLYQQLWYVYKEEKSIFVFQDESYLCKLKDGVSFHLFTSHTPCKYFIFCYLSQITWYLIELFFYLLLFLDKS